MFPFPILLLDKTNSNESMNENINFDTNLAKRKNMKRKNFAKSFSVCQLSIDINLSVEAGRIKNYKYKGQ